MARVVARGERDTASAVARRGTVRLVARSFCKKEAQAPIDSLSQTGNWADQFPDARQTISDAPIRELPPGHDMVTRVFILVSLVEYTRPRFSGSLGQFTAAHQAKP